MNFDFTIQNVTASSVKTGDYILYDGWTVRVIENRIAKTGKHGHMKCSIEARSLRSNRKVLIMLAGHMIVEKTDVINKSYNVMYTTIDEKTNHDGSTDVTFDVFDENFDEPMSFTLELDESELNIIKAIRHKQDEYELNIQAFPTKESNEICTFVKFIKVE